MIDNIPAKYRTILYTVLGIVGVVLGAIQVAFLAAATALPTAAIALPKALVIAWAVYGYLCTAANYVAKRHVTPETPSQPI